MIKNYTHFYIFVLILSVCCSSEAYAYLDPGTGSMLLSAVIALIAAVFYFAKNIFYEFAALFAGLFGVRIGRSTKHSIVFYSEGKQYWNTFKPVIEALNKRGVKLTYMSSDEEDEGLFSQSPNVDTLFIGKGNKAYSILNSLESKICIMTTPCLDVLQIRRSKGVRHYGHILHAAGGASYPLYSFDYYDSVFCTGDHQISFIRELESLRGTKPKQLFSTGATFIDVLAEKQAAAKPRLTNKACSVLIAPSWGPNCLLQLFGTKLIKPILDSGFDVVIRPHPQSFVVERKMIEAIQRDLRDYKNLSWDISPDGFDALYDSDLMISDFSGIIFDYVFVFGNPIITIKFEMDKTGTEAQELKDELWELDMLNNIGRIIDPSQINQLPKIIDDIFDNNDVRTPFTKLREKHLFNFRSSGEVAAKQILGILDELGG